MSELINKVKNAQILAGEEAVIASLKGKGLMPKENTSEISQKFFMMFVQVRKELCAASPTETYHLEEAIRNTFDRWNDWNKDMPEFDGQYLVLINQKQDCGNLWKYQKVIECFMNRWVLEDESEDAVGWKDLSNNEIVV